jgi:hypothetical protein
MRTAAHPRKVRGKLRKQRMALSLLFRQGTGRLASCITLVRRIPYERGFRRSGAVAPVQFEWTKGVRK